MKTLKFILPIFFVSLFVASCSDDDEAPIPVNEEELITSVIVSLVSGTDTVTLSSRDVDGEGPNAPVVTVSGELTANTSYMGTVQFLNETESPAENITEEVEAESDEHQVFFTPGNNLPVTVEYGNFDGDGNPLGTEFTLITTTGTAGTLNVTLRHEPKKPNDGTLGDAGGETDVSVTFDVTVAQ